MFAAQLITLISAVLYIVLYTYVFLYIRELEKTGCECSRDWKRDFIYIYICIIVPIIIVRLFNIRTPMLLNSVISILTISFIFIVFFYIHELKKKKCECSVSDTRKVLEIVNYIHLGLLGLVIIALIYAIFSGVDLFNVVDKKGKKAVKVRK